MAIFGSTARLNACRVNAFRLGAGGYQVGVSVNGSLVQSRVRRLESEYTQAVNGVPSTASLVLRGTAPVEGQTIVLYEGGAPVFDGTATAVTLRQARAVTRPTWRVEAKDHTHLLERRLVAKTYALQSPNQILTDVMSNFTSGFTLNHVDGCLGWINAAASISWAFDFEPVPDVLTKLAQATGCTWRLLPGKDLYFRLVASLTSPATLDTTNTRYKHFVYTRKLDQVRTRALVSGSAGSAATLAGVLAGATVIPVSSAYPFGSIGAVRVSTPVAGAPALNAAIYRTDTVTYGGSQRAALLTPPTTLGTVVTSGGTLGGALMVAGTYQYGFTLVTSAGESGIFATVAATLTGGQNLVNFTLTSNFPLFSAYQNKSINAAYTVTDPSIIKINVYRSVVGGSQLLFAFSVVYNTGTGSWPSTLSDQLSDTDLAGPPPQTNEAVQGTSSTTSTSGASAGASTLANVDNLSAADAAGGYVLIGGQLVQYSGYTLNGTLLHGTLNFSSALTFTIKANATLTFVPVLTGVPASSTGSSPAIIPSGTALTPFTQTDDATAQAALAAREGGDGIHEQRIVDTSLFGTTLLGIRGLAELALGKNVQEEASFVSEDPLAVAGALQPINVATVSTMLLIQRTRVSWIQGRRWPQRECTASNQFKDLYQILRAIELQAAKAS